jgi:parvulin-like peptidyl-prolyl isomerase
MAEQSPSSIAFPRDAIALLQRHDLFRSLVQRQVVAEAVQAMAVEPEEREALLANYRQRFNLQDAEALQGHLAQRGLRNSDLIWQLELPLRIQRHSQEAWGAKAEQRFLERKNTLDQVVYSLLRLKDGFLARELYLQVAEAESNFADLASQYAEGPERTTQGIVGPVPLTQAHPLLAEKLRTSSPGTLLEPFQIEQWWLVVRLERYLPASFNEAVANQMCAELFDQWVHEEVDRKLSELSDSDLAARPV